MVSIQLDVDDAQNLEYLAEGAGNVVFTLKGHKALLASHLLNNAPAVVVRFRKDLPHLPPVKDQYARFTSHIVPLFSNDDLVPSALISITPALIAHLNSHLDADQDAPRRPASRHGQHLAPSEPHALLLQDMRPDEKQTLLELKPKWLLQSPSAPRPSRRCRTCALRAMRASTKASPDAGAAPGLCPLDLVGRPDDIDAAIHALIAAGRLPSTPSTVDVLRAFLASNAVLPRLRNLQARLDPAGILALPADTELTADFQFATTLRDCTLFLTLPDTDDGPCTGRLADLDLKLPAPGKVAHWRGVEQTLRDDGWYAARRGWSTGCQLERSH